MMKANQAVSTKKFYDQLKEMKDSISKTCKNLNEWVVTSFDEKNLDLANVAE